MNNSNDTTIKSLTIVGAGTTGTMAAAYLSKTLPRKIKITLIAPEKNERTGVGEATVPSIRFFMRTLGLKENDWMHKVNATYKCGIKFTNWNQEQGSYYHPFFKKKNTRSNMLGFSFEQDPEDILNYNLNGASHKDFLNSSTLALSICENYLSPKSKANKSHVNYAYHFDAQLFADFLMAFAENQGVEIIRGDVEKVEFFENGFINSLKLASGNSIQSDFFIDCTGFKGKLIEDSLAVPFRDYSARLFTDSAIAVNISKDFKKNLPPYTESVATDSGWIWKIPLRDRWGAGIVYNSEFETKEGALQKLRANFPDKKDELGDLKEFSMPTGRRERSWEKNCVAIGLASSFIEPLESTSIALTEYQLFLIQNFLPLAKFNLDNSRLFNTNFNSSFDKVVDFIGLHYILSDRKDSPFWKYVQERKKAEDMQQLISDASEFIQSGQRSSTYQMFERFSYACLFTGLGLPIEFDQMKLHDPRLIEQAERGKERLIQKMRQIETDRFLHSDLFLPS